MKETSAVLLVCIGLGVVVATTLYGHAHTSQPLPHPSGGTASAAASTTPVTASQTEMGLRYANAVRTNTSSISIHASGIQTYCGRDRQGCRAAVVEEQAAVAAAQADPNAAPACMQAVDKEYRLALTALTARDEGALHDIDSGQPWTVISMHYNALDRDGAQHFDAAKGLLDLASCN